MIADGPTHYVSSDDGKTWLSRPVHQTRRARITAAIRRGLERIISR